MKPYLRSGLTFSPFIRFGGFLLFVNLLLIPVAP
jgi:hypothetical protein